MYNPENLRDDLAKQISEIYNKKVAELKLDEMVDQAIKDAVSSHVKKSIDIKKLDRKIKYELDKAITTLLKDKTLLDIAVPSDTQEFKDKLLAGMKKQLDESIGYHIKTRVDSWWWNNGRAMIDGIVDKVIKGEITMEQGVAQVSGTVLSTNQ